MVWTTYRQVLAAALAGWLVAMAGPRPTPAQESAPAAAPAERGRLGVFLEERCPLERETEAPRLPAESRCAAPPVVASVIVGSAADHAGIRARDTLLAIDGHALTSAEGRRALASLVAGQPVVLEMARNGGRVRVEVVPGPAGRNAQVRIRTRLTARDGGAQRLMETPAPWIIRVPEDPADRERLRVNLDSLSSTGQAFVVFSEDTTGTLRIEIASREDAAPAADATRTKWSSAYVWTDENVAQRLERVRETSLRTARVRLDSLVRLQNQLRERLTGVQGEESFRRMAELMRRLEMEGGATREGVPAPPLPAQLTELFVTDRRVAGAEFRPLTPELAEYFEGANGGLLVLRVLPGTPAARLGLRGGDVVTEIGGRACRDVETLRQALESADRATSLEVKWIRKGRTHEGKIAGS